MSRDEKSTRERWTQFEYSRKNTSLQCTRIRTQFYRTRERSRIKFKLGHAIRENNLTKRITSLQSGEKKKKKEDAYEQL